MNNRTKELITLGDLLSHGRDLLVPEQPCSPYRYIEFLIEGTLQRKFHLKTVVELGPGTDPGLMYLDPHSIDTAVAIDYSQQALDVLKSRLSDRNVQYRNEDITKPGALNDINGQFDYVICNSVIEHLVDDTALVKMMHELLAPGGIMVCTTVLHQSMYNLWDHAVGHYRRYSLAGLEKLFFEFSEVQVLQTSMAQELIRPLFFNRVRHLEKNTLEENNRLTAVGYQEWGRVPYAGIWPVAKYAMPAYLIAEWGLQYLTGGIGFVIGRK